jgi:alpha-L-fucosidase 2
VSGADSAVILVSSGTSYNGPWKSPGLRGIDPSRAASRHLARASTRAYGSLLDRHLEDHRNLFRRADLELGAGKTDGLPTDERLKAYRPSRDPGLEELLFHYGRYLLIASSRPGTQPANLQGIWNQELLPPWSSNWTLNINAEMNYWPAECANLGECHIPLLDFISELSVNGRRTAKVNYGCGGWVAHHNSDLWRQSAPVGDYGKGTPVWANWPMGGAWLCQHLWEHYAFNPDRRFLAKAYPVMKGAAEFCLDWLVEDSAGNLVTAPSFSPEQTIRLPDGSTVSGAVAATMDLAIIRDLFSNCIAASRILRRDAGFRRRLESALKRLLPYRIGARGQLQEWGDDLMESEVHHRHVSHLFGLHPGRSITPDNDPELSAACRRSLEIRGDEGTGWSLGWKTNLWARLRDGDHAYRFVNNLLRFVSTRDTSYSGGGGVYANLFDAHPPFQIDGNFAYTAGVVEMILQSQNGEIHLLPALPPAWDSGSARGLRARGGFELAVRWSCGGLASAEILSLSGGECRLRTRGPLKVATRGTTVDIESHEEKGDVISVFRTAKNRVYAVGPA